MDTSPPAVGSCHDLTWAEYYYAVSEPEPAVDCSGHHTSQTVRVTELDPVRDWRAEWPKIVGREFVPCLRSLVRTTGGNAARVQLSAYSLTFYRPTKPQRDAGAAWVRCDAVAAGPGFVSPLPPSLSLERGVPRQVGKCFLGSREDYAQTVCRRHHSYYATVAREMPDDHYPGVRAAKEFAKRKCRQVMHQRAGHWVYQWVPSRAYWRAGLRSAVCAQPV